MADEKPELEHGEIMVGGEFFLVIAGSTDETTKVDWDGNVGFVKQDQATEWARDSALDGSEYTVFRCTPIRRVTRGPVRVIPYNPKKS